MLEFVHQAAVLVKRSMSENIDNQNENELNGLFFVGFPCSAMRGECLEALAKSMLLRCDQSGGSG